MKKLFYLLLLFNTSLFAQVSNTVYIDPSNQGDPAEDGSVVHPFDSWSDITIESNTNYLQHRGTLEIRTSSIASISSQLHDIYFGAYGTGSPPEIIVNGATAFYFKYTRNITVSDLKITGNYSSEDGIMISGHTSTAANTNVTTIQNCEISKFGSAITSSEFSTSTDSITIDNCELHHIDQDAIFCEGDYLTVKNSYIHHINRRWHTVGHTQTEAGGDCIQIRGGNHWLVLNNILDRRWTGNKFCLIWGSTVYRPTTGKILWNTFYPPKDTIDDQGGDCIYISPCDSVEIAYNKFLGTGYGDGELPMGVLHCMANKVEFYYNLVDSISEINFTLYNSPNKEQYIYNNTFVNQFNKVLFSAFDDVCEVKNNIIATHTGANIFSGIANYDLSNNIIVNGDSTSWGTNPGFVDWQNKNYRIKETSPANNTGINYAGYNYDLDSVFVPYEGIRDVGAYEYMNGSQLNNPPVINNQSFSVLENALNGEHLGFILATDPDPTQSLTYSIQSGNTGGAFQVNTATGELIVANSNALDFEVKPLFLLTVQVQDNGIGLLTDQAIITVELIDINEPIANFTSNTTLVEAGESVYFYDESLNSPTNLMWQFEGGSPITSFDENPVITYDYPGIFDVRLVAINSNGNDVLIKTDFIEVLPNTDPPIANFTSNTTQIQAGGSISFIDESLNSPTNLMWQFVGGSPITSFEENPVVTYDYPGIFDVRLVAINSNGPDVLIKTDFIEVLPNTDLPIANFTSNTTIVEAGENINFYDESLNSPTNLMWQFEGGSPITSFDVNPVIVFDFPGVFNVKLVAINSNGTDVLIKTDFIEVLPNTDPPIANFTSNTSQVQAGGSISFVDESLNLPTNLMWQFEGGSPITSFDENPVITYDYPGIYNVKLVAINSNGNDVQIKTDYIEVLQGKGSAVSNYNDSPEDVNNIINLYPNPASNFININLPVINGEKYIIKIYSLNGTLHKDIEYNTTPGKTTEKIEIIDLPKGTYIMQLNNEFTAVRKKFVKF